MKNIFSKIAAIVLFMNIIGTASVFAQSTDDIATKINLAQVRLNRIDAKLQQQKNNLNKTYNNVTPDVQEDLNNREDSIYLELLSQKRTIELEIAGLKKAQQSYVVTTKTTTTTATTAQQPNSLIKSGMAASKSVENKKKTTATTTKKRR